MERPPDFTWLFRLLRDALLVCAAIFAVFYGILQLIS